MASRVRVARAARVIRAGGVVAYPTEAVYGLGCLPTYEPALERILAIKQRDAGKGLIVIAAAIEQLEPLARIPGGSAGARIAADWPGPVTWVVPAQPGLPKILTGGRDTIAVRVSAHPIVRALCERAQSALVSTSANPSGRRPARTALRLRRTLGRKLDYVLAGALGEQGRPTAIRDWQSGAILRPG